MRIETTDEQDVAIMAEIAPNGEYPDAQTFVQTYLDGLISRGTDKLLQMTKNTIYEKYIASSPEIQASVDVVKLETPGVYPAIKVTPG